MEHENKKNLNLLVLYFKYLKCYFYNNKNSRKHKFTKPHLHLRAMLHISSADMDLYLQTLNSGLYVIQVLHSYHQYGDSFHIQNSQASSLPSKATRAVSPPLHRLFEEHPMTTFSVGWRVGKEVR